jgi:membrane-associated phospholipid phosphatase
MMLLAIPSEGHHYLVDMVSGAAVAGLSIAVVSAAMPPILFNLKPTVSRAKIGG